MKRAVFLDRDGVVVKAVISNGRPRAPFGPSEFELLPQSSENLLGIKRLGFLAILISNQPDVAYGNTKEEVWSSLQNQVAALPFDDIYLCRHRREENCACKKPKGGSFYAAARKWGIDLNRSYIVGDTEADMKAGRLIGCGGILINMSYNQQVSSDFRVAGLTEAIQLIERLEKITSPTRTISSPNELRGKIIEMAVKSGSAHIAPAFSVLEIIYLLYTRILKLDLKNPTEVDRDRFILSKGHGCLAQYVVLAELGFFPQEWLLDYAQPGSLLGGHATLGAPGIEASTGSLGHGLAMGEGMAYAAKLDKKSFKTYVVLSDGECEEGSTWEAVMGASSFKLDNLVAIVDHNHVQSCGPIAAVLPSLEPLAHKWQAFGWSVREADGHNLDELEAVLNNVPFESGKPSAVIAHTIKGKGVSFMENVPIWHYRVTNSEETIQAYKDLDYKV